ncbi:Uncharacterised protein [Acinetobacter baumannii]|nr:Uncharacterised protein [Acinetobacter baumannii]
MKPASYKRCANIMVFFTEKPKRVLAACCKVEVMYGALGFTLVGLSSRWATLYSAPFNTSNRASVSALFFNLSVLPACLTASRRISSFLALVSAKTCQYSSGIKARISRSRSTTSFTATDCTRPADKPRAIFSHSNGETMKPTTRSKKRRACCALTRFKSRRVGCLNAS